MVIGFYDGSPENLIDVKFIKIKMNSEILKMKKVWLEADEFVKDRNNSLEATKDLCKVVNRLHNGAFKIANLSRSERWSNSQQKWQNGARQTSLTLNLRKIATIA